MNERTVSTPLGNITYELERKRIKRLNLRIRRDCTVHLSIPWSTSFAYADKFVADNAAFVLNAQKRIAAKTEFSPDSTFFSGSRLKLSPNPPKSRGENRTEKGLSFFYRITAVKMRNKKIF